ncbi:MAG: GNAT family N-acetyltransferase, partial [Candidatus Binataceae bacterium]
GEQMSFVELGRIRRAVRKERTARRRAELRAVARALRDGVGSVNLAAPREVYDDLFSFVGTGTLFTERQYGFVRPISIDDFEEVEALILRGQREGHLLARSREEIAELLPSCFGYRVGDEHLAGVCSLLTERYHRERAGEITALYTLTRFAGEGVAAELVKQILIEARQRPLRYVFACTAEERAANFFARLGFRLVEPRDIPPAKWRGYDRARMSRLQILRYDLD